jgi:hypothetical protein
MVLDDRPIEKYYIPQQTLGYQSIVIMMFVLLLSAFVQITILTRTSKIETSLTNMRNACVIAEKGQP